MLNGETKTLGFFGNLNAAKVNFELHMYICKYVCMKCVCVYKMCVCV